MAVPHSNVSERAVQIPAGRATLDGDLAMPKDAPGIVLFAHGSGSSRFSPRNRHVRAPTLLVVGGRDLPVIDMNQDALRQLHGDSRLEIVPGATHLFEEPGALDQVAALARDWLLRYLKSVDRAERQHAA